ncbi:Trehalose import ATP-binding protein SugC [Aquimixticola soesokkakensis]|uniref:Trehalose import ATP-binding protein SugC n=1 Tax=Aquimixticola soesokkakensis TaxID=1519096 RepID=A0A1Y5SMS9_9RHOB|nr:ABC transporter ATP-binding protein [Aquimixticola soesokkakensis]SLN41353.1 Trehalose import ATP-binding protein SugC [Aquimixticola soesokkakensis]
MAELGFRNLSKTFDGAAALQDINAQIKSGEFVALLGPSGCGKTTLLRLTAGFEQPSAGAISLGGQTVADAARAGSFVPPEAREIGIVFQSYALWPHKSVAQNVSYPLEVRRVPRAQRAARVEEALALTGLSGLADRSPAQLSGGQRQRVALARCLVFDPRAVLLDEPLANLDLALRASMHEVFSMFHRRTKATMLYVTHDQSEALALADRVAVMAAGKIRQFASPETLYRAPLDCFVAGFVGEGAVVALQAAGPVSNAFGARDGAQCDVTVFGQTLRARSTQDSPTHVSIRPESLRLSQDGAVRARVIGCTYQGGRFRLSLDTGGETLVAFAPRRAAIGETLGVELHDLWAFHDPKAARSDVLMQRALAHV